jgi:hypothetical protein
LFGSDSGDSDDDDVNDNGLFGWLAFVLMEKR